MARGELGSLGDDGEGGAWGARVELPDELRRVFPRLWALGGRRLLRSFGRFRSLGGFGRGRGSSALGTGHHRLQHDVKAKGNGRSKDNIQFRETDKRDLEIDYRNDLRTQNIV